MGKKGGSWFTAAKRAFRSHARDSESRDSKKSNFSSKVKGEELDANKEEKVDIENFCSYIENWFHLRALMF